MHLRQFEPGDLQRAWALSNIPNIGATADESAPLELPLPDAPPLNFPLLADVTTNFAGAGGAFLVVEDQGHLVGMGGIRPNTPEQAEVLHLRVHPARRRRGVGRVLMEGLEDTARRLGFVELHLDTATNQPEAVAFYSDLGYSRVGEETRPEWGWTLVYFTKRL
jgi:N-acetylglutamate synthase-like GNAT family acetyltransferase